MESNLGNVLRQIPCGRFVLTAAYDGKRSGVRVGWVQQCASTPPLVTVAVDTCLPVVPLIRDSRVFALCQIADGDRFLSRKFNAPPPDGEDPFETLTTRRSPGGAPIVCRALAWMECEVVRHIDLESDCGLYIGLVRAAGMLNGGVPAVLFGMDDQ